jgi:tRNA-dihydrouridine synthase B
VTLFEGATPILALAPMQDITDGAFWTLTHRYGGADVYWTEYFRVSATSIPEKRILDDINTNTTGRPVVAQMIGNDIPALIRTAKLLQQLPIAAIDLNLGCPAPIVYRKCAGGGLLREPRRIDSMLGALRDAIGIKFTVKTRLGFDSTDEFDDLLPMFAKHSLDALTVHARTVAQQYRLPVHYERIRQAVDAMPCPVIANGHVYSAQHARELLDESGAAGLMIGRGAIRNPWLFNQIRQQLRGEPVVLPTGRQVLEYVRALWDTQSDANHPEKTQCERMKKFLNFVGEGVEPGFWRELRKTVTASDFHRICREYLEHDRPMTMLPIQTEAPSLDRSAMPAMPAMLSRAT